VQSVFAERISQGFCIDITVNRPVAARYGLDVSDVQRAVQSGIGGDNVAENVEGRARYPVNVRYDRDFRDDIPALGRVVIATPTGARIPLGEVAQISFSRGPSMIRDEEAQLTGYVYFNLGTSNYGGFVTRADELLRHKLTLPAGYTYSWSGEYQFEQRARERLEVILPIVFCVIVLLLYLIFKSASEAAIIESAVLRLRPKLMTVLVVIGSLGPLLWATGVSSDVMKPIAAPIVGGMVTSAIAVMILIPILFAILKERALRRGTLRVEHRSENSDDRNHC
jgi:Cu/Ag efflux pump CusA